MTAGALPRRFGNYLLTQELGQDALGGVFRALRVSGERGFVRLRIFESPDVSEDALLDAIQDNGEIHSFLKNPAIARGVQMDAVEGVPFLAWNEPSGRTLDALIAKAGQQRMGIPVEHSLLIGEKVATALEHAYNTTLDGERTLHGLVWPGFVSISDDGETRLTGFGLAAGFFPSMSRPRFAREIAPYLAPEERARLTIGKNSDVYSVGVLLFELLFGRQPSPTDPLGDIKSANPQAGGIAPEVMSVLRTCLSPAESRYQSSGDLRRELGKILFSGPYSPSTFNLAFFLTSLFGSEIEQENRDRARESKLDAGHVGETPMPPPLLSGPPPQPKPPGPPAAVPPSGGARRPYAVGGALLLAAGVAGTIFVITRHPPRPVRSPVVVTTPVAKAVPVPTPEPTSLPTTGMSEGQFKEEVARRVAAEMKRLAEANQRRKAASAPPAASTERSAPKQAVPEPAAPALPHKSAAPEPTAPPAEPLAAVASPVPTPAPVEESPTASAPAAAVEENETPPKILRVVKPIYPEFALRARIRGIVVLRVRVSENGTPAEIQVLKGVGGGLSEAAVSAVRRWTFRPAARGGQPVSAWTTIPIPFEP